MNITERIHAKTGLLFELIASEYIAIDMQTGNYFSMRGTAALLWQLVAEGSSAENLIQHLAKQYATQQAEITIDVFAFLNELKNNNLIEAGLPTHKNDTPADTITLPENYTAPNLEIFTDVQDLLLIDPIHDVDEMGWPQPKVQG